MHVPQPFCRDIDISKNMISFKKADNPGINISLNYADNNCILTIINNSSHKIKVVSNGIPLFFESRFDMKDGSLIKLMEYSQYYYFKYEVGEIVDRSQKEINITPFIEVITHRERGYKIFFTAIICTTTHEYFYLKSNAVFSENFEKK